VAAALADDPTLRQVILSGADIHDATARLMYGEHFTDEQRTISKRATFGTIFGGGAPALASQTGVSEDTARQVIARWRRTYPRVIAYGKRLAEVAEVVTASGRRIPADPARPYANVNYAVQSAARDLLLAAAYTLVTRYQVGGLWLFVHDEIIVQAPERDAERVRGLLERAMTSTFRSLPILAEAKILGPSWGKHNPAPAPATSGTSGTFGACAGQHGSSGFRLAAQVPEPPEPSPAHRNPQEDTTMTAPPTRCSLTSPRHREDCGACYPKPEPSPVTGIPPGDLADAALWCAGRGWPVFPLRPGRQAARLPRPQGRRMHRHRPALPQRASGMGTAGHHRPGPHPVRLGARPLQRRHRHRPGRAAGHRPGQAQARRGTTAAMGAAGHHRWRGRARRAV